MINHSRVRQRRSQLQHDDDDDDNVLPLHNAPPMSKGRVKGLKKRRKRRACSKLCMSLTKTCLAGASAALVWGALSVVFMPSTTWLQVDYKHQVQKAATRIYQKVIRHQQHQQHMDSNSGFGLVANHLRPTPYESMYCPDGSMGWINDNYCDCLDGSDEPQTSACSYRLVHHKTFVCHDDSSHLIYASRVGDGVWDCKDGSDEKQK
jgi:hypothetical protein